MIKPQPRGREKFKNKLTPVDRLLADLDGTYYRVSEVAEALNRSSNTIRRLINKPGIKAPSYTLKQGGMEIYLYTPDDLEELRIYFYGSDKGNQASDHRTQHTD